MRWQKRARLGIAIFGIAFAVVVYFAIGERGKVTPPAAPRRVDPNATIETSRGVINRITGTKQDFTITFDQQLGYENNAQKFRGVRIEVKERQGRDFVITSGEAQAGEQQQNLQLTKNVRMEASDGFVLSTELATFNQTEGIVRTPGPVSFSKGAMAGTGVGMAYDKNTDVLTVLEQSNVRMVDGQGRTTGEFSASKATLARLQNYLDLEGAVHATRGEQRIDADRARANLTEDEKTITAIELRGNARVGGGSTAFDSMSAGDIDLDYADDGQTIERVALTGSAAIALKGNPGSGPSTPLGAGRQMRGNLLTLTLAPDGAVTSAVGRGNVELHLPASNGSAARHVKAEMLDAVGEPGKGMTSARFTNAVEYLEESTAGEPPRKVTSRALTVALDGDVVTSALFTGRVQFEEKDFKASAGEARYEPARGVLRLKNADQGTASAAAPERRPQVADEQIAIEADTIDVTFDGRKMLAGGAVKTVLQGKSKTPALLKQGQPTNVSAASLEYTGDPAFARYSGGAQLWQGDTAIRGESIAIDQDKGNLTALGGARSTLTLGDATSIGRGEEIRYEDATRQLTYVGKPPRVGAVSKAAPPPAADPATGALAQLSGPQGDLTAQRIVVHLARAESKMERLEASTNITLRLDTRVSTGGSLEYFAADERYVLSGSAAVPVKVVETCRETTGKTLTFFKSTDRIIVDGNEEIRTRTTSGGPCPDAR